MSIDAAMQQQIQQLTQLANGQNPEGGKVTMQQRLWAGEQLRKIALQQEEERRRREEIDRTHEQDVGQQAHAQFMDKDRLRVEEAELHSRLELEGTVAERTLQLEAERIEIAKAEVVLRALEIAARNPELRQLTQVVGELSYRLLGGEALPPMLEDKDGEK
jgi:hypothetical protein